METVIERNNVVLTESPAASGISAVSWPAVFAGAVAAASLSLILFILGIGLGLGALSPWSGDGISGGALGVSTILWITLTSLAASALGGYLTGRLRTRWLAVHTDEVFFRDTAHGFLAWGVATLLTAVIFTTTTAGIVSMGAKAGAAVAGGVAQTATTAAVAGAAAADDEGLATDDNQSAVSYYLDSLFRTAVLKPVSVNALTVQPATAGVTQQQQEDAADVASTEGGERLTPAQQAALAAGGASPETMVPAPGTRGSDRQPPIQEFTVSPEVARIYARALRNDNLPQEDLTYVGRLVAQHTGLSEMEAEQRISATFAKTQAELRQLETDARATADAARAASAKVALWFFVALLMGAFIGSYSATIGGRQRDF